MFTKIMQEFRAGTGAYDALNVIPAWMPDLAQAGALEPLDAMVDKYGFRDELKKIAPTYRDNQMTVGGKIYGFPDDGDVFLMYYRKDLFAREDLQKAYKAKHNADLAVPKTWDDFEKVGTFFTAALKSENIYGGSMFREPGYGNFMFQERFRNEGGKFFDANMKATVNTPAGVKVLKGWLAENKWMPKGVEKFGFVENLAVFLKGESAMTISWPPYGRFAAGYLANEKALDWVPKSQVAGKVGYALPPGGHPELAAGFALSVASTVEEQGSRLPVHPVAEQRRDQQPARAVAVRAARPVPRFALHEPGLPGALAGREGLPRRARRRREDRAARPVADPDRQVRRSAAPGHQQTLGRRRPAEDSRQDRRRLGRGDAAGRRGQAEGRLRRLGGEVGRVPEVRAAASSRTASSRRKPGSTVCRALDPGVRRDDVFAVHRLASFMPIRTGASERHFKLSLIAPSIFVLLLIGVFPLVYLLVVSFQGITMTNNDPSFQGLRNYALLFQRRAALGVAAAHARCSRRSRCRSSCCSAC